MNLPACKKRYLSHTPTHAPKHRDECRFKSHLQVPCVPWICFSESLLRLYVCVLVHVHLWNALTRFFPVWSAAAHPRSAANAASSSLITLAVRLNWRSSSPSVLGHSCSSLPWSSSFTALFRRGESLPCSSLHFIEGTHQVVCPLTDFWWFFCVTRCVHKSLFKNASYGRTL